MLAFVAIGLVMGVATEFVAYALKLWLYRNPWLRVLNVILVFGLVFGRRARGSASPTKSSMTAGSRPGISRAAPCPR
jgi:hypothetical protein